MSLKDAPAFPRFESEQFWNEELAKYQDHMVPVEGMNLLQYYAGKALEAIISSMGPAEIAEIIKNSRQHSVDMVAEGSVNFAEALVGELERRQK